MTSSKFASHMCAIDTMEACLPVRVETMDGRRLMECEFGNLDYEVNKTSFWKHYNIVEVRRCDLSNKYAKVPAWNQPLLITVV